MQPRSNSAAIERYSPLSGRKLLNLPGPRKPWPVHNANFFKSGFPSIGSNRPIQQKRETPFFNIPVVNTNPVYMSNYY